MIAISSERELEPGPDPIRLTTALIRDLLPRSRDYFVRDAEVRRLQLKVTPAGSKSFILRYRNAHGRERKQKIGDFPDVNVTVARRLAGEALLRVASGMDPAEEKKKRRKEATFSEYSAIFMLEHAEIHLRSASTVKDYRRWLNRILLPRLGNQPMRLITRSDVEQLMRDWQSTPYQANRAIGLLKTIFNHAIENGILKNEGNPTHRVKRFKEEGRERLLSLDEQERLGTAIKELRKTNPENSSTYDAIIFLFLTGCRRGEALRLEWQDIDFERKILRFSRTKTVPRTHYMSDALIEFLRGIDTHIYSDFVFPGRNPDQPLSDPKKSWARIQKMAGIHGVRIHDIRHTVLSDVAAETDIQTAALVGGHRSLASTMRYVHGRSETARNALQKTSMARSGLLTASNDSDESE